MRARVNSGTAATVGCAPRARVNRVSGRGRSVPSKAGAQQPPPGYAWVVLNGVQVTINGSYVYTAVP